MTDSLDISKNSKINTRIANIFYDKIFLFFLMNEECSCWLNISEQQANKLRAPSQLVIDSSHSENFAF